MDRTKDICTSSVKLGVIYHPNSLKIFSTLKALISNFQFFPPYEQSNFQDIKEDSMGDSNPDRDAYSDKDFDDIPDSYEGLQVNYDREAFESSDGSRQADAGSSSTMVSLYSN